MARPPPDALPLIGVDFSSRPSRRKPIVVARGWRAGEVVTLQALDEHPSLEGFGAWLADPANGPWTGGFDLPFGLPRELVQALGWPLDWLPLVQHYAALERAGIRATFATWCAARPAGGKFAHRRCDGPAGSSPSMKWVNPPLAYMLHAGVPLLLAAGVHLPGHHEGDPARVALEAYPGLLARELIGRRSYKSDERARQTPERAAARQAMLDALLRGSPRLGLRLSCSAALRRRLVDDPSGDALDAALCLLQAGWAARQPGHGLPPDVDPVEGWIVSAVAPPSP